MRLEGDVVVVGAGPTGLMLAGELALAGVRVIVLERRVERVRQSRAMSMHTRSMEILALRGIADRFIRQGLPMRSGHFAGLDTRLDFAALDSRFASGLLLPQAVTEQLLEEWAIELGSVVRRGWIVDGVREEPDAVHVSGTQGQGTFEVMARYLVGADGARSIVRSRCDIGFPGSETDQTYYFADVRIQGGGMPAAGRFAVHRETGSVEAFPIADGRHRIIFIDPVRFSVPPSTPVTLEELQDGARRIIGPAVLLSDPSWMSRFGNETRLADRYRKGRVFLAGDAAHIHLPAGGQGMNTGLQDAMNLGWKLAGVLQGRAVGQLLDSYEAERRPVGQRLIDNTRAQEAILSGTGRRGAALQAVMNHLLRAPAVNRVLAEMITGVDIAYPDPLQPAHETGESGWSGKRLPDAGLRLVDGSVTTLYASMHAGDWIDLRIEAGAASPVPPDIESAWVRSITATPIDETSPLWDLATVLVRPDGHVAFAGARSRSVACPRER
jgi:2-polyprenyl-6-methoxyphenol hydroxylase-like FAD-dependent oxidoreductase